MILAEFLWHPNASAQHTTPPRPEALAWVIGKVSAAVTTLLLVSYGIDLGLRLYVVVRETTSLWPARAHSIRGSIALAKVHLRCQARLPRTFLTAVMQICGCRCLELPTNDAVFALSCLFTSASSSELEPFIPALLPYIITTKEVSCQSVRPRRYSSSSSQFLTNLCHAS